MDIGPKRLARGPLFPAVVAVLIAAIVCVQGYILHRSHEATWLLAERSAENVLNTLAANIERNLDTVQLSLIGLESASLIENIDTLDPTVRSMLLFDRAASARDLGAMIVLSAKGDIRFDSSSPIPRVGNFSDRDYFRLQLEPGRGTFISRPFPSRLRNGEPSMAMSRRISNPDGSFGGIAVASIRMEFFRKLFTKVDLGADSVIALMRTDGILLFRHPPLGHDTRIGTDIATSPIFQKLLAAPGDHITERSTLDGIRRYYVSARIGDFPLMLAVGISTAAAMKDWNERALVTMVITAVVCVLIVLLFRALRLALVHSQDMEEQLEIMAVTDALTGIPNRRAFDMAMGNEMKRAARYKTELSVLMVDVDHFKRVNDTYSHAIGDEVLKRVARHISEAIRRPGDFAARYGGEEFVVLLPCTGAPGAQMIAERIRRSVMVMTPSPNAPALQQVTVSIGVISQHVTHGQSERTLLQIADDALYAAKAAGRNKVVTGPVTTSSAA